MQVRAVVLPLPPQAAYPSSARNSIRSRAWGTAVEGFSYRVRSSSSSFRVRSSSAGRSRNPFTRRSPRKHTETGERRVDTSTYTAPGNLCGLRRVRYASIVSSK